MIGNILESIMNFGKSFLGNGGADGIDGFNATSLGSFGGDAGEWLPGDVTGGGGGGVDWTEIIKGIGSLGKMGGGVYGLQQNKSQQDFLKDIMNYEFAKQKQDDEFMRKDYNNYHIDKARSSKANNPNFDMNEYISRYTL